MRRNEAGRSRAGGSVVAAPPRRWLLLVHQLPASPSNLRVKTWRRLQELGALPVKQSVYALPDSAECREDFEWLRAEIEGAGGEAAIFAADVVALDGDAELVEEFRRSRQSAYTELAVELEKALSRRVAPAPRELARYKERLAALERIDFFGSAGRDRAAAALSRLESKSPAHAPETDRGVSPSGYRERLWVTRPRPGVDRMSSAWLIRRFIDPAATFAFVADAARAPRDAVPFDMFGAGIGHKGDLCTFEHLMQLFGIMDTAVARLAAVVHDLDLKDSKFSAPEAATVGAAIDGLQLSCDDDHQLLERGTVLFEALYRSFARSGPPPRPRAMSRSRQKRS